MLEIFNNNHNLKHRRSNSDLINVKDEYTNLRTTMSSNAFNTGISNTATINELFKTGQKKLHNIKIMNLTEKKSRNFIKLNKLKQKQLSEENILSKRKNQTQANSLSQKLIFFQTALDNIPNITIIQKKQKQKKNIEKNKYKNRMIYYNSSMENFYKTQNDIESPLYKKMKSLPTLPRSSKVNFINNILTFYKLNNKDKKDNSNNSKIIEPKIKLNKLMKDDDKQNENINKILKGFSFVTGNKPTLNVLFHKIPIKIKPCLQSFGSKIKPDSILNPITNSYGNVLNHLSGKIGFMKDSINMIYQKISKARSQMKGPTMKFKSIKRSRSLVDDYNLNNEKNKSNLYKINERKNLQTFYTKYPINSRNKNFGENLLPFTMYSLRRKK